MDSLGPADVAQLFGTTVAVLSTVGGFVYWAVRRSAGIATKSYVERHVEEELDPIESHVVTALDRLRTNEEELEELKGLIHGGPNQFDKGILDFLDENIERTKEIREELDEIHEFLSTLEDRTED
ncbi:hypothetical protein [Halorussus sp. MSC15.2]|uniref:hypothetical protein n=1 Tax=Halorussus sp. MSC15.2 TaxID=2283638 RepID=UPI0013D5183E|nr:hypothetical protein [Halorussus sp. MSC15.2]NEU57115.1 hypothetical protein [Halorussus sp. MSC15.2]